MSQGELNRASSQPLFSQVKAGLLADIQSGAEKPGDRIPAEGQLAEMYGVGRITVRRAISDLCESGYLIMRQGKGTFVKERRVFRKIEHLASFTESCRVSGMEPSARVVTKEVVSEVPSDVVSVSRPEIEAYLYIQRVHYADRTAILVENNYYPLPRFSFLQDEPLRGSLFETLRRHGVDVGGAANSYLDADAASKVVAEQLSILQGDPVFVLGREILDTQGDLIYCAKQYIAGSRYRFLYDRV